VSVGKPALLGGRPVREGPFPPYNTVGEAEKEAVRQVLERGVLSGFYGTNRPEFYGGPAVRAFEREWVDFFEVPYAVSMNSATSCLYAAVGALEIGPGDEVIVTPYTMGAPPTVSSGRPGPAETATDTRA